MNEKKLKHILVELEKKSKKKKRICCWKDCQKEAISSHLLQKNGVLNQIAENGKLYELKVDYFSESLLKFKSTGLKDALTFPGFCIEHDTEIFSSIETQTINFNNYNVQLLFSYRALINERRKKEILVDFYDSILNSSALKSELKKDHIKFYQNQKQQQELGIRDSRYYEELMLTNIENPNLKDFSFFSYEFTKKPVCISGTFSYETTNEINLIGIESLLTQIYFHLIPQTNKSIFIIGFPNTRKEKVWDYIISFENSEKTINKKISSVMINQLENWLCSPKMYDEKFRQIEDKISLLSQLSYYTGDERTFLDIDLFE